MALKLLIAPNSFKGSINAPEAADIIEKGIRSVLPETATIKMPVADGGDFTLEVLTKPLNARILKTIVHDSSGRKIRSAIGLTSNGMAIIELAAASGIRLVPPLNADPMNADTFGTGELIKYALDMGSRHMIIGIGGSATVDGGTGLMRALGIRFYNVRGKEVTAGGGSLNLISRIDLSEMDSRIEKCKFEVLCDVNNPLLGPHGAARVYAPQKGATPEEVELLESNLNHFASLIRQQTGLDVGTMPYGGASGGAGLAMHVFLNAELLPGTDAILNMIGFEDAVQNTDLVITAEGRIDKQTLSGKGPFVVATRAKKYQKKVIGIAGSVSPGCSSIFDATFSLIDISGSLNEAMENARQLLFTCSANIASLLKGRYFME